MNAIKHAKKVIVASLIAATLVSSASAATFDFTFTGLNAFGSGSLVADDNGNGTFTAVSGSGTQNVFGVPDSLSLVFNPHGTMQATSASGLFYFDNQAFPAAANLLTDGGLLFMTGAGNDMNLFSNGNGNGTYTFYTSQNGSYGYNELTAFTLAESSAVPEPGTVALVGLGLLGVAFGRKKRKAA